MIVFFAKEGELSQPFLPENDFLFTTRAVHLEVAGDLSTDSFIMALRRFRGRRGNPKTIRSNNGTNFVEANREQSEALKSLSQERITGELAGEGITWYFNPPSSPHMGVDVLCQL